MREEYSSIYWVFAIIQVANYEHMYWRRRRRKRKTLSFFLARKNCEKTTKTKPKGYLSGTKTDFFTVFFWRFTILAKTSIFDLGLSLRAEFRFWPSKRFWQRIFGGPPILARSKKVTSLAQISCIHLFLCPNLICGCISEKAPWLDRRMSLCKFNS